LSDSNGKGQIPGPEEVITALHVELDKALATIARQERVVRLLRHLVNLPPEKRRRTRKPEEPQGKPTKPRAKVARAKDEHDG
jgi:hypothetical protein